MKLVDTSSWIEFLRGHQSDAALRVKELVRTERAGWCDLVAVELWNGVRAGRERKTLEDLEGAVTDFALSREVWLLARKLAVRCRESGLTVPSIDIVISACAMNYGLEVERCDNHFDQILPIALKL